MHFKFLSTNFPDINSRRAQGLSSTTCNGDLLPRRINFAIISIEMEETLENGEKTAKKRKRRRKRKEFMIELPYLLHKGFTDFTKEFYYLYGTAASTRNFVDCMALVLFMVTSRLKHDFLENMVVQPVVPYRYWKCHLSSVLLREIVGDNYNAAIKVLADNGFIGRTATYVKGDANRKGKCKAFWLCAPYQNSYATYLQSRADKKLKNTEVVIRGKMSKYTITSPTLLKRIRKSFEVRKAISMEDPVVRMCYSELEHFSVDEKVARRKLAELRREGVINEAKEKIELDKVERFNGLVDDPADMYVKHDTYGRIHTNVTNMKKEVRHSALRCDGEAVCEVDIKSSQAAFIIAVFRRYIRFYRDELEENRDTFIRFRPIWNEGRKDITLDRMEAQLARYEELVREGRIYEFFRDECSRDFDIDRQLTRDEAKEGLLSFLFSPLYFDEGRNPVRGAVQRCWREHFNDLFNCMWSMKESCHAALAYEMQKIESDFVFHRVCPRILEDLGCHFCTVHDSIIVPDRFAESVRLIMDEELMLQDIPTHTEVEFEAEYDAMLPERPDANFLAEMGARGCSEPDFDALN